MVHRTHLDWYLVSISPARAQWPAVPFSALNEENEDKVSLRRSRTDSASNSPPRFALNGVSTFAHNAFRRQDSVSKSSSGAVSAETLQRRKEAEEEKLFYPGMNRSSSTGSDPVSPVIPLSPDPFGRFSSTPDPADAPRQNVTVWDAVPVGGSVDRLMRNSQVRQSQSYPAPRTSEASSRFSADSSKDQIEIPASIAQSLSGSSTTSVGSRESLGKAGSRSTVLSMKGIKNFWRKSNKNSVSLNGPPTPLLESSSFPFRPSADEARSLNPPPTPTFPTNRAPSPESLQNLPQHSTAPIRPSRPSRDELFIPDIPEQLAMPLHPSNGRPAPMPIIAAQMQAGLHSHSGGDRMKFDQESPYPMPSKRPQPRKTSVSMNNIHTAGASSRTPSPASSAGGFMGAAAGPSMISESRTANVRKSILKWKAAAAQQNSEQVDPSAAPSRLSTERTTPNGTVRPRGPSLSTGPRPSSVSPSDVPPSPRIPDHFLSSRGPTEHFRMGSHLTTSSTDSRLTSTTDISSSQSLNSPVSSQTSHHSPPPPLLKTDLTRNSSLGSVAKLSMDSDDPRKTSSDTQSDRNMDDDDAESRPSIDSSQFEMVSPKMKTLSYPYTTVDSESFSGH